MKRTARRPARLVTIAVVAVGTTATLSGCGLASPATITTPYPASDGTAGTITDPATNSTIKLENFLIVSSGKGQPGSLVGAVVNGGSADVSVQLIVTDQSGQTSVGQTSVSAPHGKITQVGPAGTALSLPAVPQPPGAMLTLLARTSSGGSIRFNVPVLPATGVYATLTPPVTPAAN